MKVSFKLSSVANNVYEITLSSVDESIISSELRTALGNLEIVEVFLDRISFILSFFNYTGLLLLA